MLPLNNILADIQNPLELEALLSELKPHRANMRTAVETAHLYNCEAYMISTLFKQLNQMQIKEPARYAAL